MRIFALLLLIAGFAPIALVPVYAAALSGSAGLGASVNAVTPPTSATANAALNVQIAVPIMVTRANASTTLSASANGLGAAAGESASATASVLLRAHAAALIANDANISFVSFTPRRIELSSRAPAKLFGIFSITVPVTIAVDANGTTTINFPWYSFALATDEVGLSIRAQAAVQNELSSATAAQGFSAGAQAQILDSLHAVLVSEANASAGARTQ